MRCHSCSKELASRGGRYCRWCGSRTARLVVESDTSISLLRSGKPVTVEIVLRNVGISDAQVFSCEARVLGSQKRLDVEPRRVTCIEGGLTCTFRAVVDEPTGSDQEIVEFRFESDDGERQAEAFPDWDPNLRRPFVSRVDLRFLRPGDIELCPQALFLGRNQETRDITITNPGSVDAQIAGVSCPPGTTLLDDLGSEISYPWQVRPGKTKVSVRCDDLGAARGGSLRIDMQGRTPKFMPVFTPKCPEITIIPAYIVGIDFGTSHTSIAVRDLQRGAVELIPDSREQTRFPSAMYVQSKEYGGQLMFGTAALNYAARTTHRPDGFLVDELKTALRDEGDRYADQYGPGYSKDTLLRWYFRHLRSMIGSYFRNNMDREPDEEVDILYYVTLPVLDNDGERSRRQSCQTKRAIEGHEEDPTDVGAGFPRGRVVYKDEPSSAALYCFQKLRETGEFNPRQDTICVFDSGGGTTDICVLSVTYSPSGEPEFAIHGISGIELGGYNVTDGIMKHLDDEGAPDWTGIRDDYDRFEVRMGVEVVKADLTSKLAEQRRNYPDLASCADCSVGFEGGFPHRAPDLTFSKAEEDIVVEPLATQMGQVLTDAVRAASQQGIGDVHYVFAVGGNSLVPRIRERVFHQFNGNQRSGVLPGLTAPRPVDCMDRVLIGDQDEIQAMCEAVVRGSVMWYGAKLARHLPFSLTLIANGRDERLADERAVFRAQDKVLHCADPSSPTECYLRIESPLLGNGLGGECALASFSLPSNSSGTWKLDFTLDDANCILTVGCTGDSQGRQAICSVDLSPIMAALS